MTIEEQIMKLQTYKMYEGEDTVYVERNDVLKALNQQLRDCKTCKHSDNGNCASTEECHECMWESKYEQQPCEDCIRREDAINALRKALYDYEDKTEKQFKESKELNFEDWFQHRIFIQNMNDIDIQTILNLPSVIPSYNSIKSELKPCKDCISREAVLMELGKYLCGVPYDKGIDKVIKELPSVQPQPKIDEIIKRIEQARDKDKIAEYPYNRCIKIIREVLNEG